jgi:DNA-binding MarR family transcriptional regulator
MDELHTILADHRSRFPSKDRHREQVGKDVYLPTSSDIPDLFFDQILVDFKLTRIEIMVLMYLYRHVWCRPNLYRIYGISQLLSHTEMSKMLGSSIESIYHALRRLEEYGFIGTVRSGQYFVRKYFTRENDERYAQTYDDFEV